MLKPIISLAIALAFTVSPSIADDETPQQERVAAASQPGNNPFSGLVGRKRTGKSDGKKAGRIDRFVIASDERVLLFDDRTNSARVQFLCGDKDPRIDCVFDEKVYSPEILTLTPTRGPRGDVIYKSQEDRIVLRIASYGGATVYWPGRNDGAAASKSFGDDDNLELPHADLNTVVRRARMGGAYVSAKVGAPIPFEVDIAHSDGLGNYGVLADAIVRTAAALSRIGEDETSAEILGRGVKRVRFALSDERGVALDGQTLTIQYQPVAGLAGRPSSFYVRDFLENQL